jgi:Flp pilus assembly protein TadD
MEASFNLGVALDGLDDFAGAEEQFRHVLRLNPDDTESRYRLGITLAQQSKCAEALDAFEQVVAKEPTHAEAHWMAGRELAHFERHAEARAALVRLRELRPDLMEDWQELLDLWERVRNA